MESSKKCTLLKEITFPVYRLKNEEPTRDGTLLYYHSASIKDKDELLSNTTYIDDTSVQCSTLGMRRLVLKNNGVKLHSIRVGLMQVKDLVKSGKSSYWYIDSTGKLFQYIRTRREKLFCAKVQQILPIPNSTGCVVVVENIPTRFKLAYRPATDEIYAGILTFYGGYLLYSMYKDPFRQTYRKV